MYVFLPAENDDITAGDNHIDGDALSDTATVTAEQGNQDQDAQMELPHEESSVEDIPEVIIGDSAHEELDDSKETIDARNDQNGQSASGTCSQSDVEMYSCPLCEWETSSAEEVIRHVNVTHVDGVTPTTKTDKENESACEIFPESDNSVVLESVHLDCPLCAWTTTDVSDLEEHVDQEHQDILNLEQDATPPRSAYQCMMCDLECPDSTTLETHVNSHFHEEPMVPDGNYH